MYKNPRPSPTHHGQKSQGTTASTGSASTGSANAGRPNPIGGRHFFVRVLSNIFVDPRSNLYLLTFFSHDVTTGTSVHRQQVCFVMFQILKQFHMLVHFFDFPHSTHESTAASKRIESDHRG